MGKPYSSELNRLAATYNWAMNVDISGLTAAISSSSQVPLLAIGSGGSLTAANFATLLHNKYTGNVAKAVTPLELVFSGINLRDVSVLFLSAGGRNPDIINAFKRVIVREPYRFIVMCASSDSELSRLAITHRFVDTLNFLLPSGKDGFLATNSLLAFSILLCRAYAHAFSGKDDLPKKFEELLYPLQTEDEYISQLREQCNPLWTRKTLIALHGVMTQSVAFDLESKFTEASLGSVQIADYRNFAHGRHHWLAKHGNSSAILAFVTDDDQELADKTLNLIPSGIPVMRLATIHQGFTANLATLISVFHIAGFAGEARNIDPGRPGVPKFGRQLYNLRAIGTSDSQGLGRENGIVIERKTGTRISILAREGQYDFWNDAYKSFIQQLSSMRFQGIVFDYDGTLCDEADRYTGIDEAVASQLQRLLMKGIVVGVATGRGKSVKQDLRSKIAEVFWPQVVIGYYNGSDNALLSDDDHPIVSPPCEALGPIVEVLKSDPRITLLTECTYRRMQVSVVPKILGTEQLIWDIVQQIVQELEVRDVGVLRSSHSVDIVAPGVSKRAVVEKVREVIGAFISVPILCIGDRGRWPGNDFDLLREVCSLSVDEVSTDPKTCWNIAPAGHRGVQATLDYLNSINSVNGKFRFDTRRLKRSN